MNLWDYEKVAVDLRYKQITVPLFVIYIIIFLHILPATAPVMLDLNVFGVIGMINWGLYWIITASLAYYYNSKGDKQSFWKRYICLTTSIQFRLLVKALGILLVIGVPAFLFMLYIKSEIVSSICFLSVYLYFYGIIGLRLKRGIRIASGQIQYYSYNPIKSLDSPEKTVITQTNIESRM